MTEAYKYIQFEDLISIPVLVDISIMLLSASETIDTIPRIVSLTVSQAYGHVSIRDNDVWK